MITALLFCLSLSGAFDISLAPDQPMPFIYVDDPLIIEFSSDADAEVEGRLLFRAAADGAETECRLDKMLVRGGTEYWYAVHNAPENRGLFYLNAELTVNGEAMQFERRYCRIDRPAALTSLPIYAHCGGEENTCPVVALRNVGINTLRVEANNAALPAIAQRAAAEEVHLLLVVPASGMAETLESIKPVVQSSCEHILRFEVVYDPSKAESARAAELIRETGCPAGISFVVNNAAAFAALLGQNSTLPLRHVSLAGDVWPAASEVRRIRQMAVLQGLEGLNIHVICPAWHPKSQQSYAEFLQRFFEYKAEGAGSLGINAALIADDMGTQEMMAWLNGLSLRCKAGTYVGTLAAKDGKSTMLFRTGASWLAVIFGSEKQSAGLALSVDGSLNLELSDAFGNPLPVPEIKEGKLPLNTGTMPLYLTGDGGVILGDVALQQAARLSSEFLAKKEITDALPPEFSQLVKTIGAEPKGAGCRLRFMELLRYLPGLEEALGFRTLPRQVVVPALMLIVDLARSLAVIEEDRAELFVEPLPDIMSKTEELQSLYLTASSGSSRTRERSDWILSEVRRLLEEAETLEKTGRKIEATAVAQIAYWRAQCLKPASQAETVLDTGPLEPLVLPGEAPAEAATVPVPVELPPVKPEEAVKEQAAPQAETPQKEEAAKADKKAEPEKKEEAKEEKVERNAAGDIVYSVKKGDNPYLIAQKYGVSLDDLLKWNKLTKKSRLSIGQKLIIKKK
jgi:LysM repeat protein